MNAGAAVRFRGINIGQVTTIGLSGDIYESDIPFHDRRQ
ncbi:MlaD family protein [Polynucleobacter necessarius]|nr:MlaD family protein [Polynucleobacter necessarius]